MNVGVVMVRPGHGLPTLLMPGLGVEVMPPPHASHRSPPLLLEDT